MIFLTFQLRIVCQIAWRRHQQRQIIWLQRWSQEDCLMLRYFPILEHSWNKKGFLIYMVQDIYAHKGNGSFLRKCLEGISHTGSTRRTISCDVCEKNNVLKNQRNQRCATGITCRWALLCQLNLLRGVVAVWSWLSLIFAAQTKTCAHDGQNATEITSALTDTWIQFPGPVTLTLVKTLCLSLVLMTIFLTVCYLPFSPSFVTMSSSKPIDARRMSEWYKEFTDKDDDPHYPFSIHVSDVVVGRNRSLYQKQESIENDEEGLAMEKDDYTSSASTSSSVSSSSIWSDENEHNMWNSLLELFCHVQVGLRMETLVDEVATARAALSCHFALDPLCDKSGSCRFPQKRLPRKALPLWHICGCTICACADLFGWRTLWHTPCTALVGGKSHSDYLSVSSDRAGKQCRPKTCRPSPLPLWPLWSTTASDCCASTTSSHVWRCQSWAIPKVVQNPAGDWQRHPANAFHTWRGVEYLWIVKRFFEWTIALGKTDREGEPEPG